jgi:ribosomal protein S21
MHERGIPKVQRVFANDSLTIEVWDDNIDKAIKIFKQRAALMLRELKQRHQHPETTGQRKRRKVREAKRRAFRAAKRKEAEAQQAQQRRNRKRK